MTESTLARRKRRLFTAGAIVIALALIAGGLWWWSRQQPMTDRRASSAFASDPNAPFEVLECKPRLLDGGPALAVIFSQPVDRKQKLADSLRVADLGPAGDGTDRGSTEQARPAIEAPKLPAASSAPQGKLLQGAWVVGDNARIVLFPFIQPQRRFRIDVGQGLRSADGARLAQAQSCEVASEAMPPSFQFASRGVVLPAGQNGGLGIVTVNVPEVDLQFLRVEPAQWPGFFERVAGVRKQQREADNDDEEKARYGDDRSRRLKGAVGGWELDELHRSTKSVYLGRYATGAAANKRHVAFIPVESIRELQEPGVYVAVMGQPGRFTNDYQVTYFYVSDIGVHARRYARSLDAFATSLKSGEPLGGVSFELLDENARSLAKADADAQGHASFANVPDSASLLVARRGQGAKAELSVIVLREPGLDLSEFDVGGHPSRAVKLFAYAGRDLYRPGESYALSVLVRDADGKPVAPFPISATLKRPDGRTVGTTTWRPDDRLPGYLQRTVALPPDAQTGKWTMELRADPGAKRPDAVWTFQVEEFLPERMKLDLKTDKPVLMQGDPFVVQAKGDYLFGAPAAGNRLLVAVATERQRHAMPQQWPGFVFGDFADDARKKREELGEQTLDDSGAARVDVPVAEASNSPMLVRGSFSLLESGGRPVVRSIERAVWPAPKLLAVRPLFDREVAPSDGAAAFELIRVDVAGKPQPLAKAPVRLVREDRQYYWRFDDQKGWHSGYTETDELVESGTLAVQGERTRLNVPVRWGRYRLEIDDPETGRSLRYRFYAGWNAQEAEDVGNRPDRVQLKLAKAPLAAGDKAELTIHPPHDGHALVTVEGDRLLWSRRIPVEASGTAVSIAIDPAWSRHDLYVTVTAFRPGSAGDRVTPARAVGLVHLPLARADRQLKVAIQAPAKVLPERRAMVKVRAEGLAGQGAVVTLSAVDVGILNITRYKTPDPFDFFFGKHRYAPDVLDLYGKLIEKIEGTLAKLAYGGDAAMRSDSRSLPKKVRLVDLFSGPVRLDANGEADIALEVPDFNGTLRLMAVVASAGKFGRAEAEMVAAAPIAAELAMPRFISPGDSGTIALDVTNLSGAPQQIDVRLQGAEPVRVGSPAEGAAKTLHLKNQQRTTLRFPVEATDAYGLGLLRLHVTSASGLEITRGAALQVQPATPAERDVQRVKIDPGASYKLEPPLQGSVHKGSMTLNVALSNQPPLNLNRLVQGLLDYPYGCLEQTASAAYPHVFIDEGAAKAAGLQTRSRDERAAFIEGAIARMAGMQKANGGFTLWGDGAYEVWLTAYVAGFLHDARAQGFAVPESMFKRAQGWLLEQLHQAPNRFPGLPRPVQADASASAPAFSERDYTLVRDSHQRFAELAHAGYMLALDQRAPLAMLRYLHDNVRDRARSPLPLVHLAIALKAMGDDPRSAVALEDAMKRPYGIQSKRFGWGEEWLGDYGSGVRDSALAYALLVRHDVKHERRESLLFDLADGLGGRHYWSTQERLALFLAARAAGGGAGGEWSALLKTGDKSETLASKGVEQRAVDPGSLAGGVWIVNRHDSALFAEIEAAGFPLKAPEPKSDVIELRRDWFETDGRAWNGRPLKTGEMLIVRVQARSKQRIENGLVIDRIPAGFEIENLNLSQGPKADEFTIGGVNVAVALKDPRIKHREYRDDRYVAAARLEPQWLNVFYMVRVVTPGRFVVPATFAEDMYRPELRGVGKAEPPIVIGDPRGNGEVVAKAAGEAGIHEGGVATAVARPAAVAPVATGSPVATTR